jgi:hypothetical protein
MPNLYQLPERFLDVLRPPKTGKARQREQDRTPIDNAEYGAFLMRAIRAWEARVIDDPEMLAQNVLMEQRFKEITNVVIAANAERYAVDPRRGASMAECARILGMSTPAASKRRALGVAIMADRIDRAGAVRFSEARREREALERAHEHAVAELSDYRARHAAAS